MTNSSRFAVCIRDRANHICAGGVNCGFCHTPATRSGASRRASDRAALAGRARAALATFTRRDLDRNPS